MQCLSLTLLLVPSTCLEPCLLIHHLLEPSGLRQGLHSLSPCSHRLTSASPIRFIYHPPGCHTFIHILSSQGIFRAPRRPTRQVMTRSVENPKIRNNWRHYEHGIRNEKLQIGPDRIFFSFYYLLRRFPFRSLTLIAGLLVRYFDRCWEAGC